MMGKSGVEVRLDCAAARHTWHRALKGWLRGKSTSKSVVEGVEGVERRDLFGGKAQKSGAFCDTRKFRVRESRFMPQL
jgi:hypothetical protein